MREKLWVQPVVGVFTVPHDSGCETMIEAIVKSSVVKKWCGENTDHKLHHLSKA